MPGHSVTTVEAAKESFYCRHCQLLLRDAIQNEEGFRFCKDCCDVIKRLACILFTIITDVSQPTTKRITTRTSRCCFTTKSEGLVLLLYGYLSFISEMLAIVRDCQS